MDRIECSVCTDQRVQCKNFFIEYIYILSVDEFKSFTEDTIPLCGLHTESALNMPPNLFKAAKLNRQQIKDTLKFIGVKVYDCPKIINKLFVDLCNLVRSSQKVKDSESYKKARPLTITLTRSAFNRIVRQALDHAEYWAWQHLADFKNALDILFKRRNLVVLLGGTSGTGKSSLSSLLASRLGISNILSTDSIRHILRNFLSREENPVLFCSTYEAGQFVEDQDLTPQQRTVQGYNMQCELVYPYLESLIERFHGSRESIVIEGVHLSVPVMKKLMKKFDSVMPFMVIISNSTKHKERFAVRSKYMTLDPLMNKYVGNIQSIRVIQKRLTKLADQTLIPKIDNTNLDRSLGLCHTTILRCLRSLKENKRIYDPSRKQTVTMNHEFNYVSGNIWSSDKAQKIIKSKVNKGEIFKRLFGTEAQHESDDSGGDAADVGSIASGSVNIDARSIHTHTQTEYRNCKTRSVDSIPSEDEMSDSMRAESESSGRSNASDGSVGEVEEPIVPVVQREESKVNHKRKKSL